MPEIDNMDPLLQLVVDQDLVSPDQLEDVLEEHEQTGKQIAHILVDLGILDQDQLLEVIAGYLGTDVVNLPAIDIPPDVIHSIPASVARMYNVVPMQATPKAVTLAV